MTTPDLGAPRRGQQGNPDIRVAWAMPSRWTFSIPPIRDFVLHHTRDCAAIVDPMCGASRIATYRNDLQEPGGEDAESWTRNLFNSGIRADAVLFDPPYSPRQIAECYKSMGRDVYREDTQSAHLYRRIRKALTEILLPGGSALSFGWQSSGFGKNWQTLQILLVQHGGAHNDTICVAQRKPISAMEAPDAR